MVVAMFSFTFLVRKKYIGCSNVKMKDELFSRAGVSFYSYHISISLVCCSCYLLKWSVKELFISYIVYFYSMVEICMINFGNPGYNWQLQGPGHWWHCAALQEHNILLMKLPANYSLPSVSTRLQRTFSSTSLTWAAFKQSRRRTWK